MDNNSDTKKPYILSIDDDHDMLSLLDRYLTNSGYRVGLADNGAKGLEMIKKTNPDLILLDTLMPELDGYDVCSQLQKDNETAYIPVIFVTSLGDEQSKARAFAVGAVDYLVKPFQKDILLQKVNTQFGKRGVWKRFEDSVSWEKKIQSSSFMKFKDFLFDELNLSTDVKKLSGNFPPSNVYNVCSELGIKSYVMARHIATFMELPYISCIDPAKIQIGVLPTPFCLENKVVPVNDEGGERVFVISNPFNLELIDSLKNLPGSKHTSKIKITEPDNIEILGKLSEYQIAHNIHDVGDTGDIDKTVMLIPDKEDILITEADINKRPVVHIANTMITKAAHAGASDIRIEPKEDHTVVRYREDGIMSEKFSLKPETAAMVISRLKTYASMDIAERRKPQDGSFTTIINNKRYSFRLATASTPHGESITMRLLETHAVPKSLIELGMTKEQSNTLINLGNRTQGLILLVGATGSGKTTSVYSLLQQIDCNNRSLISIEDPVEYSIPTANQEQVNVKAGITFESLLKSSVRQDPDILFVGEIRDEISAKACINFASTGHLTISTLHTSNATTAIHRLERLGIDRQVLPNTIIGIVAQVLMRKLCTYCREITKISDEEVEMLLPFTYDIPTDIARPVGCSKCNSSGYSGREGIYEILQFDKEISEMVRSNVSIAETRAFAQKRGDLLISHHAIGKLKEFILTPKDVYEKILVGEVRLEEFRKKGIATESIQADKESKTKSILIVDDDEDSNKLIALLLKNQGYNTAIASDGIDALISLDKNHFDLILSDINMPHLDGLKLLEIMNQKGVNIPIIFLTGQDTMEVEKSALELGAVDYIKKPIRKETLLLRIKNTFNKSASELGAVDYIEKPI